MPIRGSQEFGYPSTHKLFRITTDKPMTVRETINIRDERNCQNLPDDIVPCVVYPYEVIPIQIQLQHDVLVLGSLCL